MIGISNNQHSPSLLIYQWPGWWFGTMEWIMTFQKQLGIINHPNRRTPSFFRGVGRNRQPDGDMYLRNLTHYCPLMDLTIHFSGNYCGWLMIGFISHQQDSDMPF